MSYLVLLQHLSREPLLFQLGLKFAPQPIVVSRKCVPAEQPPCHDIHFALDILDARLTSC